MLFFRCINVNRYCDSHCDMFRITDLDLPPVMMKATGESQGHALSHDAMSDWMMGESLGCLKIWGPPDPQDLMCFFEIR